MARSSFTSRLRRVDLPAFVSPIIATGMPFFTAFPTLKECTRWAMMLSICVASVHNWLRSANSTSSSLKSNSSSMREVKSNRRVLRARSSLLKPPRIWFIARRWVAAFEEAIRSATASAWLRSILPFRKARWVYSPGLALRHPLAMSSCMTCWRMYDEPWHMISVASSPV